MDPKILNTFNSTYNEKKYADIFLYYRWLFIKGDIIISEREIFGVEVFLHYSQLFIKGNFIIGRVECNTCDAEEMPLLHVSGESQWLHKNTAANSSLTAGGVENCHFLAQGVNFPPNLILIHKTPLYKGMVVWILK